MKNLLLLIVGAVVGGIVGYFGFLWLGRHGFYGMVLPGGLIGIGAGLGKSKSFVPAILCAVAAIALGFFADWKFEPWVKDDSLGYYLRHIPDLSPVTLIMIAVGAVIAFWIPFRRMERASPSPATK
jgi:hypothetical protein